MRFIYIGGREFDGTSLPGEVVVHGVSFVLNVPTELPDSVRNADIVRAKLRNHPHFRAVPDPMEAVATLTEDEFEQLVQNVLDVPAPKRRGRPRKAVADNVTDAAQ
jgi:hypothetical protein